MRPQFDPDRDVEFHHREAYLAKPDIADDFQESGLTEEQFLEDNDHFHQFVIEDLEEGRW